jgi:integrase
MADLTTKTARRRLPASKSVRWVRLARGLSLGYRRPAAGVAGSWYVRRFVGAGQRYRVEALGSADDVAPSNGEDVLTYQEASEAAGAWSPDAEPPVDPTVAEVVESYLGWYRTHRKSWDRVRHVFGAHVLPELGELRVSQLTARKLKAWHAAIAEKPARLRGGQEREAVTDDQKRARKVTANRALSMLKAALNHAVRDGELAPGAWSVVKPFRGVEAARVRYLEAEEIRRLLNASPADLRAMITAAIHTGARYSELASLRVGDYLPEAGAVHLPKTKTGAPRHVYLSEEAVGFFDRLTAGRAAGTRLLERADGGSWGRNHQYRPMIEACRIAGIEPAIGVHQLRHTYASLYLMSGGSLIALAKQLGHTSTRMVETHYGHLADAWRAEEARKHAPRIAAEPEKVKRMRRRR